MFFVCKDTNCFKNKWYLCSQKNQKYTIMKIISPQYEIWEQKPGRAGIYQQIERAGRVCYKSEDRANETSAQPFVERMIASEHFAMLEHGTVYLTCQHGELPFYASNRFSHTNTVEEKDFITTNLRVLAENNRMDDLKFLSEPTEHHEHRVTVHFTTQIAITREYNRHRANSMAEQSTRYCNYSKNKFGNEISVNLPTWVTEDGTFTAETTLPNDFLADRCKDITTGDDSKWSKLDCWLFGNLAAEFAYMKLIEAGCKPQEARVILPLDCNTELVHTAFVHDWQHFFDLRALGTTGAPHPDAKILAQPLYEEFKERGYLKKC